MKIKKWDIVICACLGLALSVFVFELRDITPIARIYPAFVLTGSYIMIAIVIIRALVCGRKKTSPGETPRGEKLKPASPENPALEKGAIPRIMSYCAAILAYILLIEPLGYILSTIAFAVFSLVFLRNKNKITLVALPVIFALAMYFIFSWFLYVRLPAGELFSLLGVTDF
jgi:hypothetical protein